MQNIKRIEDLIKNEDTFESVYNIVAFWELCNKIDSALRAGEDYTIPHYMTFAKSVTFQRHKTSEVPRIHQRLTFYGQKYYVYE